jgi:hypothetical protein
MKIWIFSYGKQPFNMVLTQFTLLLHTIKCWYNTPLQVLTKAPALHSLTIRDRNKDVDEILEFVFQKPLALKRLIFGCWSLDERSNLDIIEDLYPDLEGLSLEGCYSLSHDTCRLITRLKKLSELKLRDCEVDYMCVLSCYRPMFLYVNACSRTSLEIHFIYLS